MVFSTWAFWVILIYFAVPSLPGWATKNWLPTLFAENLGIPMSQAGPMSTITIAASSFIGVIVGGVLSDKWVLRNIRGRVYTSAIGLGMTIPALVLLGFGHSIVAVVGAGLLFGMGYGMFDANNMPILCRCCRDTPAGQVDRRRQPRTWFCRAGLHRARGSRAAAGLSEAYNRQQGVMLRQTHIIYKYKV